jgi:uncharacterized protein
MISQTPISIEKDYHDLELHIVRREGINVAYHPPTLTFFKINAQAADVLDDYVSSRDLVACAQTHACAPEEIENLLQTLHRGIKQQIAKRPAIQYETTFLGDRLTLLVSQDCNMRCRYCNAYGGDYGHGRALMTIETALQTLETFTTEDFNFTSVQFFGGEPTLNVPVIHAVCERLTEMGATGRISQLPVLGIITNGLSLSDDFIALVKAYDIGVTISLDGPQEINDRYRVDVGGNGTYRRVVESLRKLQAATDNQQPEMIEATMTRQHFEQGITYDDLSTFFAEAFGISRSHIALLEEGYSYDEKTKIPEKTRIAWHTMTQAHLLKNLRQGNPKATNLGFRLLTKLIFKQVSPYICPVGVSSLTVDVDGTIYPCYQLMKETFKMGSVFDPEVLTSTRFKSVEQMMRKNTKNAHPQCRTCWARGVCSGCVGELYASTGSVYGRIKGNCEGIRESLAVALCGLAKLRTDKITWSKIVRTLADEPATLSAAAPRS